MDIILRVNRVSTHGVLVPVTYNGQEATATLPELEVELHDENGLHGSFTPHFRTQSEVAEANSIFKQGGYVRLTIADVTPPEVENQPQGDNPPAEHTDDQQQHQG